MGLLLQHLSDLRGKYSVWKELDFCGGSSFFELGSASDMLNFFSYLNKLFSN